MLLRYRHWLDFSGLDFCGWPLIAGGIFTSGRVGRGTLPGSTRSTALTSSLHSKTRKCLTLDLVQDAVNGPLSRKEPQKPINLTEGDKPWLWQCRPSSMPLLGSIPASQDDAMAELAAARKALGPRAASIVDMVVVGGASDRKLAARLGYAEAGKGRRRAEADLMAAMTVLVEHFKLAPQPRVGRTVGATAPGRRFRAIVRRHRLAPRVNGPNHSMAIGRLALCVAMQGSHRRAFSVSMATTAQR